MPSPEDTPDTGDIDLNDLTEEEYPEIVRHLARIRKQHSSNRGDR